MTSAIGNNIRVQLFGQSHSEGLGVVIDGLPAGEKLDLERVNGFLEKRAGGRNPWSTKRAEPDAPVILSGLVEGVTCGAPLCAVFENRDARREDYEKFKMVPRPSHADYTAFIKHGGHNDASGGGHFSGRLTLPLCFAGAVCLQLLERKNIRIDAHIHSIGNIMDAPFSLVPPDDVILGRSFPAINPGAGKRMIELIEAVSAEGDSIGGVVECCAWGLPAGLGEPIFDNIESRLAYGLFAVPGAKGLEFGRGFESAEMKGSEANDPFYYDGDEVKTHSNHSGGILGGITNGMPVVFRTAFKPTPSISKEQQTVNLSTGEDVTLTVKGRHDPCIAVRALPCVIAVTAIVLYDIIAQKGL